MRQMVLFILCVPIPYTLSFSDTIVTRLLAENHSVCIVDTGNEIAGGGDTPHPCVGFARRIMVPSLEQQSEAMIECAENQTPEITVIDNLTDVEAARSSKNHGIRLIASAQGSVRKLVNNPKLRGLVEGGESGPPLFDVIVELKRGEHHVWRVITNTVDVIDCVLNGKQCMVQRRTRDPANGSIQIKFEQL